MDTLEMLANAVSTDIRLFFEYSHFEDTAYVDIKIKELLESASPEQKKIILKILTAVLL